MEEDPAGTENRQISGVMVSLDPSGPWCRALFERRKPGLRPSTGIEKERNPGLSVFLYRPQFYCCEDMDGALERARADGIELDEETIELASMKEKG